MILIPKVTPLKNDRGNVVANHFTIEYRGLYDERIVLFQSYESVVCCVVFKNGNPSVTFYEDWDYSVTTAKHLNTFLKNEWLGCIASTKDRRKAIAAGEVTNANGTKIPVAFSKKTGWFR